jgi:hypothetical protein
MSSHLLSFFMMTFIAKSSCQNVPSMIEVVRGHAPLGPNHQPTSVSLNGVRPAALYTCGLHPSNCFSMPSFVASAIIVPSSYVMSILDMEDLMILAGLVDHIISRRRMAKMNFLSSLFIICFSWFSIRSSHRMLDLSSSLSLSYGSRLR